MNILKNIYTKILTLSALLALGILNSCSVDPNEGIDLRVDWNIIETTASFQFVDAKTGELVGYENGDKIEIIVKGNNKEVVVDITGKKTDDFEAVKGSLNLALDPNAPAPSEDQPVDFTVTAMIDGYAAVDFPVQIFRTGAHEYEIKMINLEDTPEGVIVTSNQSFDLDGGATTETVMVNVSNPDGMEAEVIIPEGTLIKDKDGNPLEGPIKTTVMYFDPNTDDFLDYFPELSEAKVRGSNETASVIPASFLFMDMRDKNGNQPATFETPGREEGIEISGTMDDEITNPETGEQMQPGDMGKIMILDEETGEWVEQGDTEVSEDGRWHWRWRWYSYRYWRYWYWGWYYYPPYCYYGGTVTVQANNTPDACDDWSGYFRFRSSRFNKNFSSWGEFNESRRLYGMRSTTGTLYYTIYNNGQTFTGSVNGFNPCSGNATINISPQQLSNVTIDVDAFCPGNPNNYIEISGQRIWYRQMGTSSWKSFILNGGEATVCGIQQGAEYEFFTVYDGEYYEWSAVANTTNFSETYEIPVNICNEMGF